ncbi:hypothetical protein IIB49_01890, partial [Patescibacteria group bacterium]|nr:hypothetical protein [Patescibacteria group bacterium]
RNGRPVVGLSYDESNDRYFNTHFKSERLKRENFGSDYDEAIFLFRQWESQQKGERHLNIEKDKTKKAVKLTISEDYLKKKNETDEAYKKRVTKLNLKLRKGEIESQTKTTSIITIPESYIFAKARELILDDIVEARKKLNHSVGLSRGIKCGDSYGWVKEINPQTTETKPTTENSKK